MRVKSLGSNTTLVDIRDMEILISYETPVAAFVPGMGYIRTSKKWSRTTTKHINKYLGTVDATEVRQEYLDNLLND